MRGKLNNNLFYFLFSFLDFLKFVFLWTFKLSFPCSSYFLGWVKCIHLELSHCPLWRRRCSVIQRSYFVVAFSSKCYILFIPLHSQLLSCFSVVNLPILTCFSNFVFFFCFGHLCCQLVYPNFPHLKHPIKVYIFFWFQFKKVSIKFDLSYEY